MQIPIDFDWSQKWIFDIKWRSLGFVGFNSRNLTRENTIGFVVTFLKNGEMCKIQGMWSERW